MLCEAPTGLVQIPIVNHRYPKQPLRPGAALMLLDMRCQKLEYESQVARPRAGGAKDSSHGQAKNV